MGISFKGHDINWQYWVFDIDGRDWVAVNQSTPEPLKIQFQGRFRNWGGDPLSKEGGFDIVASTSRGADKDGQNQGTVEWTWNGVRYKSAWTLIAGNEIVAGDPAEGIETVWDYQLGFIGRIAYDGPAGGAVGTGVASQAVIEASKTKDEREDAERRMSLQATSTPRQIVPSAQLSTAAPEQQYPLPMSVTSKPVNTGIASPAAIQAAQSGALTKDEREDAERRMATTTPSASYGGPSGSGYVQPVNKPVNTGIASPAAIQVAQSGEAIQETRDAIAAAFKALSVSKSQGTVNVNAFNNARIELKNAKDVLAVAQSRATPGEQILMSQLEEQVDTIQGEVDIQLRYLQAAQATQTPSGGGYSGPSGSNYPGPSGGGGGGGGGGSTPRKVTVLEPGKPYGGPSGSLPADTAAGPDWVKLALQVGTAYLLLS